MTNKQLLQRIEDLERRVRDLEARPVYVPMPYPAPQPYPYGPWWGGKLTIGDHTGAAPRTGGHETWSFDGRTARRVT